MSLSRYPLISHALRTSTPFPCTCSQQASCCTEAPERRSFLPSFTPRELWLYSRDC
ncbi:hypothetical protein PILCRDRAFT_812424 [Piloderma croceum F 1598]|uniref:Uncharacterized protein n=1 Tax=Piloderma croceum (strain F 1598) TaxID=765440 RepID=A0A0C3GD41_PILCF|nr:hypothetical protein PILCRDRAFT_812424 [Piloderma croceum F 1598]